jgi:hypothetical protein
MKHYDVNEFLLSFEERSFQNKTLLIILIMLNQGKIVFMFFFGELFTTRPGQNHI